MQYYHSITSKNLKDHISRYKSLSGKKFSTETYKKQQRLEESVDRVLNSFEDGKLHLKPTQYALFAQYISVVAPNRTIEERLFDQLQAKADFDVRAEAKRANLTWYQKLFHIDPDKVPYLSKSKLNSRIKSYKKVHHYFQTSPFRNYKMYQKGETLRHEAQEYMQAFLDGKVTIKGEDRAAFAEYVKVFEYPLYAESTGRKCLDKLNNLPPETVAEKRSFKTSFASWVSQFRAPKSKSASSKTPKHTKRTYIRAALVALLLAIGGTLAHIGLNKNSSKEALDKDKAENKTEKSIIPSSQNQKQNDLSADMITWGNAHTKDKNILFKDIAAIPQIKTGHNKTFAEPQIKEASEVNQAQPALKKAEPTAKTVKTKSQSSLKTKDKEYTTSEKQAIINHHNHVIEMRLGKKQAQKLNDQIQTLRDDEILSLPSDVSNAEVAYAFVMYRAYGVKSSLKEALASKEKLSAEQNQKVLKDIKAVGNTGDGVKKLAEIQHQNKGELNHTSCYDNATQKDKKQHAKNLKQLRQIQKAKQRAA